MTVFDKGLITVLACDVLFCLVSIPLILRRIPPNPVYGFRTATTLSSPAVWYEANAHFGLRFLLFSVGTAFGFWLLTRSVSMPSDLFLPVSVAAIGLPVLLAGVSTSLVVKRLAGKQPAHR